MDFEKATLKKAAVSTLPFWAEHDQGQQQKQQHTTRLDRLPEVLEHDPTHSYPPGVASPPTLLLPNSTPSASAPAPGLDSNANSISPFASNSRSGTSTTKPLQTDSSQHLASASSVSSKRSSSQDWSVFATMSNVSTISDLSRRYLGTFAPGGTATTAPTSGSKDTSPSTAVSNLRKLPGLKLDEIFKTKSTGHVVTNGDIVDNNSINSNNSNICTCNCPQHRRGGPGIGLDTSRSKRRNRKESMEAMRGYPTGQCISTEPPEHTAWDEKDTELPLTQEPNTTKNTAFNLESMKAFLNSPLFSNFLKTLTVMTAVSLFAIALDAIIILIKTPDHQTQLSNDNAVLIFTVILSILTIAYSCFTIFLESRRPPEGLDSSNSKPLIVIFTEIIASIIWAQVLSISIYIYVWTYGCTAAGQRQIDRSWKQDIADEHLHGKLCRRQGAMVGLEFLLVLLVIFNFYTHLAQNFKFIRAVS